MHKPLITLAAALALSACGGDSVQDAPVNRTATLSSQQRAVSTITVAHAALAQQLYVAFFGRPADPDGLAFYVAALARFDAPTSIRSLADRYQVDPGIRAIVDDFAASMEAQALYGGDPDQLISALYRNGFNRDADDVGRRYWVNAIQSHGLSTGAAVVAILAGAQGTDLGTFQRKTDAARMFTDALDAGGARAAYAGHGANALVRDMLGAVRAGSADADIGHDIDAGIARLRAGQAWIMRDGHAEVPADARQVLLLVAGSQQQQLRSRLETLATVLAADLNARAGEYGPVWSVSVQRAASTVTQVREQLKNKAGAILVGDVVVPTDVDAANGETRPDLDPYRLPSCVRYRFPNGTQVVKPALGSDHIWTTPEDPTCRHGMTVSILRGSSPLRQSTELATKLDQMIAYHRAGERANAAWTPSYHHVNALWLRTTVPPQDGPSFWKDIPLFAPTQIDYLDAGTGQRRLDAFRSCLSSASEMCTFNGHGTNGFVVSEGPDPERELHSRDAVYFNAYELRDMRIRAKFVNLQSCSTQNFLMPESFGTTMLTAGDALLVLGATAVVFQPTEVDKMPVQEVYQTLSHGATFAEAFTGKLDNLPLNLQGDPFISLRPKPAGAKPAMVVDGKHYNAHPSVARLALGDSTNAAVTYRTVSIANNGNAQLNLRLSNFASYVTATGLTGLRDGFTRGGLGFTLEHPRSTAVSGFGNVGEIVHVVPAGGKLELRFRFEPQTGPTPDKRITGTYTGIYEIYSNDPEVPRLVFELSATAH